MNRESGIESPRAWMPTIKKTTTGELYDCGPPSEQQYTSMQNTEDRNAPITAVENQPITAQPCALQGNA